MTAPLESRPKEPPIASLSTARPAGTDGAGRATLPGRPAPATRMLAAVSRAGKPGRILAPQLDGLRGPGIVAGLQRWRPAQDDRDTRLSRSQTATYVRIWRDAAAEVGADLEELGDGFLRLFRAGRQTVVWRHLVMFDHPATTALALDKSIVHRLLSREGLQVPDHIQAAREDRSQALEFLNCSPEPCVIKPVNGTSGGAGVTCGVECVDDLWRAWLGAARWDSRILIEGQTRGEEYRLLFLDGQLLDAVRRRRPTVTGDGRATVVGLIDSENMRRVDASGQDQEVSRLIEVDLDCELAVRGSGLTLRSVPENGRVVTIKSAVSQNAMRDNASVGCLSADLVREAARAAELLHLRLAGVDVVTADPGRSLAEGGGAILEVNATPGLHYHYQVANLDQVSRVAVPILARLLGVDPP
jgi:D-alanine-D-alanine ligase-like ATP-grasp enzyme